MEAFTAVASAGSLRPVAGAGVLFASRWTEQGVTLAAEFTGAHLLHAAVASCVLNDLYREAGRAGVVLLGVEVSASGGFTDGWESTGVEYRVQIESTAPAGAIDALLATVDAAAEIPRALRAGAPVRRID